MAYLTPDDFREGTNLWGDIKLPAAVDDTTLTEVIDAQSTFFDSLTRDHFEEVAAATIQRPGSNLPVLFTPGYRLSVVTTVELADESGSSPATWTEISPIVVHTYGIERPYGLTFPRDLLVRLSGVTYGWPATPYLVKRAVALLVYDVLRGGGGKHHAVRWSTQNVEYEIDPTSLTGMPEVDRIIRRYRVPNAGF